MIKTKMSVLMLGMSTAGMPFIIIAEKDKDVIFDVSTCWECGAASAVVIVCSPQGHPIQPWWAASSLSKAPKHKCGYRHHHHRQFDIPPSSYVHLFGHNINM